MCLRQDQGFDLPGRLAEFLELRESSALLRSELAALWEEQEYLNRIVIPNTQTNFVIKVGALQVELLQVQVDVMRIRRKLGILRNKIEKGENLAARELEEQVALEFQSWDEKLKNEHARINEAKARFSSLPSLEDAEEIQSLYRRLAAKLHPEINPDQGAEARAFWPQVHLAYAWGDLFQLKALFIMASDYPDSYDLPSNLGRILHNCDILKGRIRQMMNHLEKMKQHPVFEWKRILDDPQYLASEQGRLREEIHRVRIQRTALADILHSLQIRALS